MTTSNIIYSPEDVLDYSEQNSTRSYKDLCQIALKILTDSLCFRERSIRNVRTPPSVSSLVRLLTLLMININHNYFVIFSLHPVSPTTPVEI